MTTILITGIAGFIGHALAHRLADNPDVSIVGIDNLNPYYDPSLKRARLNTLTSVKVQFEQLDLLDKVGLERLFKSYRFERVVHLAAQAGVRYSIDNPDAYGQANLIGFLNVLECCRQHSIGHLVYASSSSVYGVGSRVPYAVEAAADQPASLYGATKRANELMAYSYSYMYGLPTTGLRFFTVYGPWGRPDMALFKFTRNILENEPIPLYNFGKMSRDFTYIDDIVESIARLIGRAPASAAPPHLAEVLSPGQGAPFIVHNIGRGSPVSLESFVEAIERATGRKAVRRYEPMQLGDMQVTWADCTSLFAATGYTPQVDVDEGVARFVQWYRQYYGNVHAAN